MGHPLRLSDYFFVMGADERLLPYPVEQSDPNFLQWTLKPRYFHRFPEKDWPDSEFQTEMLDKFCFPDGIRLTTSAGDVRDFAFVMTGEDGTMRYGAGLVFYQAVPFMALSRMFADNRGQICSLLKLDHGGGSSVGDTPNTKDPGDSQTRAFAEKRDLYEAQGGPSFQSAFEMYPAPEQDYPPLQLSQILAEQCSDHPSQEQAHGIDFPTLYAPRVIGIISHWPFYSLFRGFLVQLYRLSTDVKLLPDGMRIERYIMNFILEAPLPPRGKVKMLLKVADRELQCARPPNNELPLADVPFSTIFECMSVSNIVKVVTCVLTEQHILLYSSNRALLTIIAEILRALMFPFTWHHVYIPILPGIMKDFIFAPMPFIMGIMPGVVPKDELPPDAVFVDLDADEVIMPPEKEMATPYVDIPDHQRQKLIKSLSKYSDLYDVHAYRKVGLVEMDIKSRVGSSVQLQVPLDDGSDDEGTPTPMHTHSAVNSPAVDRKSARDPSPLGSGRPMSFDLSVKARKLAVDKAMKGRDRRSMQLATDMLRRMSSDIQRKPSPQPPAAASPFAGDDGNGAVASASFRDAVDMDIRRLFLRLFVSLFMNYREFLLTVEEAGGETDFDHCFRKQAFVADHPEEAHSFMTTFLETQAFQRFVQERMELTIGEHYNVIFFDESIDAKINRSKLTVVKRATPFLSSTAHRITGSFYSPTIEPEDDDEHFQSMRKNFRWTNLAFKDRRLTIRRGVMRLQAKLRGARALAAYHLLRKGVIQIQAHARGRIARRNYVVQRAACLKIQSVARGYQARRLARRIRAAIKIQSATRGMFARKAYKRLLACIKIQSAGRMFLAKMAYGRMRAAVAIQAYLRMKCQQREYAKTKALARALQCRLRGARARKAFSEAVAARVQQQTEGLAAAWRAHETPLLERARFISVYCGAEGTSVTALRACHYELARVDHQMTTSDAKQATKRRKAEYSRLYEGLRHIPNLEDVYNKWGIDLRGKKRKQRLMQQLFISDEYQHCVESAQLTMMIENAIAMKGGSSSR